MMNTTNYLENSEQQRCAYIELLNFNVALNIVIIVITGAEGEINPPCYIPDEFSFRIKRAILSSSS